MLRPDAPGNCCEFRLWRWNIIPPSDLTRSNVISPIALCCWRGIAALYILATFIYGMWESNNLGVHFTFYTNLTFGAQAVFFSTIAIYCLYRLRNPMTGDDPSQLDWFQRCLCIAWEIISTDSFIVTVVYWSVLYRPGPGGTNWSSPSAMYSIFAHATNAVITLVELSLTRIRHIPLHCIFLAIAALIYMCFTWVVFATSGRWVYGFLNWSDKLAPAWYLGLVAGFIGMFFLIALLGFVRDHLFRCQPPRSLDLESTATAMVTKHMEETVVAGLDGAEGSSV